MDLAVKLKRSGIFKLLLRYWKPEFSTLIMAIEENQTEFVPILMEKLQKYFDVELNVPMKRYLEISKEIELKNISKDRKSICKTNLEVYKRNIISQLRKITNKPLDNQELEENPKIQKSCDELLSEFDCPICFELMSSPKRIFSCSNDHYICSICLTDPKLEACPQCREDFKVHKPNVRHTSEQILARLLQK